MARTQSKKDLASLSTQVHIPAIESEGLSTSQGPLFDIPAYVREKCARALGDYILENFDELPIEFTEKAYYIDPQFHGITYQVDAILISKKELRRQRKPDKNGPKTLDDLPDWMTTRQVRNYLQISENLMCRLIRVGAIPVVQVGRVYRIQKSSLKEYIERHKKPYFLIGAKDGAVTVEGVWDARLDPGDRRRAPKPETGDEL